MSSEARNFRKSVRVGGVWIRAIGKNVELLVELEDGWRLCATELLESAFGHIVEPSGIINAPKDYLDTAPRPAPTTPAATPLREANQQRVDAAAQRVRQAMDYRKYLPDDTFRKDVELLIEIALAPVLEIFAAAQPQRESDYICTRCMKHVPENAPCPYCAQRESEQPEQARPRQCGKCGAYEESGSVNKGQCVACGAWLPEPISPQTDSQ